MIDTPVNPTQGTGNLSGAALNPNVKDRADRPIREGAYVEGADIYNILEKYNVTTFTHGWTLRQVGRFPEDIRERAPQESDDAYGKYVDSLFQSARAQASKDVRDGTLDLSVLYQDLFKGRLKEGTVLTFRDREGKEVSIRPGNYDEARSAGGAKITWEEYERTAIAFQIVNNDYTPSEFAGYKELLRKRAERTLPDKPTADQIRVRDQAIASYAIWKDVDYQEYIAGKTTEGRELPNHANGGGGLLDSDGGCGFNPVIFEGKTHMMPPGIDVPFFMQMDCKGGVCRAIPPENIPTVRLDAPEIVEFETPNLRAPVRPVFNGETSELLNGRSPSVNKDELAQSRAMTRGGVAHAGNWYLPPPERPPARGEMEKGYPSEGIRADGPTGVQAFIPFLDRRGERVSFPTATPQANGKAPEAYVYSQFTDYRAGNEDNKDSVGTIANLTRIVRGSDGQPYVQADGGLKPISIQARRGENNWTVDTTSAFTQLVRSDLFDTAEGMDHFSHLVVTAEAQQTLVKSLPQEMLIGKPGEQIINWPGIINGDIKITKPLTPAETNAVLQLQALEFQTMFNMASYGYSQQGVMSPSDRIGRMSAISDVFADNTSVDTAGQMLNQTLRAYSHNPGLNIDDWNPEVLIKSYEALMGAKVPASLENPYRFVVWERAQMAHVRDALDVDQLRFPSVIVNKPNPNAATIAYGELDKVVGAGTSAQLPAHFKEWFDRELVLGGDRAKEAYRQLFAVSLMREEGVRNWERIVTRGPTDEEFKIGAGLSTFERSGADFQSFVAHENGAAEVRIGTPRHLAVLASGAFADTELEANKIMLRTMEFMQSVKGGNEAGWARIMHRATQDGGTDQHKNLLLYERDADADRDARFLEEFLAKTPGLDPKISKALEGSLTYNGTEWWDRVAQIATLGSISMTNNMADARDEVLRPAMQLRLAEISAKLESGEALSKDESYFMLVMRANLRSSASAPFNDGSVSFASIMEPNRNQIRDRAYELSGDASFNPEYLKYVDYLTTLDSKALNGNVLDDHYTRQAIMDIGRENADNNHELSDQALRLKQFQAANPDVNVATTDRATAEAAIAAERARANAAAEAVRTGNPITLATTAPQINAADIGVADAATTTDAAAQLFAANSARAREILKAVTADDNPGLATHAVRVLLTSTDPLVKATIAQSLANIDITTAPATLPAGLVDKVTALKDALQKGEAVDKHLTALLPVINNKAMPETVIEGILTDFAGQPEAAAVTAGYQAIMASKVRTDKGEKSFTDILLLNMNKNAERLALVDALFSSTDTSYIKAIVDLQQSLGGVSSVTTRMSDTVTVATVLGSNDSYATIRDTVNAKAGVAITDPAQLARVINVLLTTDNDGRTTEGDTRQAMAGMLTTTSPAMVQLTMLQLLAAEKANGQRGAISALLTNADSDYTKFLNEQADLLVKAQGDTLTTGKIYQSTLLTLQSSDKHMQSYAALTQHISQSPVIQDHLNGMLTLMTADGGKNLTTLLTNLPADAQGRVLNDLNGLLTGNQNDLLSGYLTSLAVAQQTNMLTHEGVSQTDIALVILGIIGISRSPKFKSIFTQGSGPIDDPTKPITLVNPNGIPLAPGVTDVIIGPPDGGFLVESFVRDGWKWRWMADPLVAGLAGAYIAEKVEGAENGQPQGHDVSAVGIPPLFGLLTVTPSKEEKRTGRE